MTDLQVASVVGGAQRDWIEMDSTVPKGHRSACPSEGIAYLRNAIQDYR